MVVTDTFTKYVELIAIPDKKAETVAMALFTKWLCRYQLPNEIVSDSEKEFCNEIVDKNDSNDECQEDHYITI